MKNDFPIKGLKYYSNFITEEEANLILQEIDNKEWNTSLARRVQHYGMEYDYKNRALAQNTLIEELPLWAQNIRDKVFNTNDIPFPSDQLIINEYIKNQGIAAHTDCEPCFEDGIACISLLEPWEMRFSSHDTNEKFSLSLEPRSLLILTGEARYKWTHEIPKRSKEPSGLIRQRRLSITLRTIKKAK